MATAPRKARTGKPPARGAGGLPDLASLAFRVNQDNDGEYHWEITGERGENLARSGSFTSHDDAERAARSVRDGAGSARFEAHPGEARQLAVV